MLVLLLILPFPLLAAVILADRLIRRMRSSVLNANLMPTASSSAK
jgi:hypothetical protein